LLDGLTRGFFSEHAVADFLNRVGGRKRTIGALIREAGDHALVKKFRERLWRGDMAQIKKHFVPEARVEQMQYGMLGSAHIQVNAALAHPIFFSFFANKTGGVFRIAIAQVIPA